MSLDYPDVYMCMPDLFVKEYSGGGNNYYNWAGYSTTSYEAFKKDEACDLNEHKGSFIKVDPLTMRPFGSDTSRASYVAADDPGSCPAMKGRYSGRSANAPADTGSGMRIGCPRAGDFSSSAAQAECDDYMASFEGHAGTGKLMSLIPRTVSTDVGGDSAVGGADTCDWPRDGECDVDWGGCDPGTDCSDCPDDQSCGDNAGGGDAGDGEASCDDIQQEQECVAAEDCTYHPDDPACLPRACDDENGYIECVAIDGCTWDDDSNECGGDRRRMQSGASVGMNEPCTDITQEQECVAAEITVGSTTGITCTWHPDGGDEHPDGQCSQWQCGDEKNEQECVAVDSCTWDGSECSAVAGAYEPMCLMYGMKPGSKQYYDEKRKYFLAMQQETDEPDKSGAYWVAYLTEAGTAPYHCNSMEKDGNERCTINATTIFFPGMPSTSIAMLSIEYVKDLRADPEAAFVPVYKYNMWNKMSINSEDGSIQLTRGIMGFQYGAPRRTMPFIVCYRSNRVEAGLINGIVHAFDWQRVSSRALSRSATSVRARFWPRSAVCGPLQRPSLPSFGPTAAISTGRGAVK